MVLTHGISTAAAAGGAQGYPALQGLFLLKKAHALVLRQRASLGQAILIKELAESVFECLLFARVVSPLFDGNLDCVLNICWHGQDLLDIDLLPEVIERKKLLLIELFQSGLSERSIIVPSRQLLSAIIMRTPLQLEAVGCLCARAAHDLMLGVFQ